MKSVSKLVNLIKLEQLGNTQLHFKGESEDLGFPKVFGGQVIAQALSAACQTVKDRDPHSLHAYFIRPGDVNLPIEYEVEAVRDGRSFSVRQVKATQKGVTILTMTASFQQFQQGCEHQTSMPNVPPPEVLTPISELYEQHKEEIPPQIRERILSPKPIEFRIVESQNPFRPKHTIAKRHMWIRSTSKLPDDPLIHQCMLAYTSDYGFLETALMPHGLSILHPKLTIASLDHAIWFHRPFRLDEWLLYVADSPSAQNARGFVRGEIFNQQKELVASIAQEGMFRVKD
ncbi:acyl-CoA thioesterase [Marinicellulosiphila megalodicopiae]|uniref:acyl-CoA thioesterase n=1 Tax=Marinicellulosiphila megalodicopiae TaxID=2724896 RepID=UPI003BB0EC84